MTTMVAESTPTPLPPPEPEAITRRRLPSAGWLPLAIVLVVVTLVLHHFGVAAMDIAKFAVCTLYASTLPGLLIWRSVRGRADYLPLDAAFGTVTGFVIELPLYLLLRQFDVPYAVGAWPLVVVVLYAVVPRLRRYWRGSGRRLPLGVSWTVAAGFLWIVALMAVANFPDNSLSSPANGRMGIDYPFQFALVGEFKHHVPLSTPWVAGTGLQYHWYVYAHGAATSWISGIEPQTLVLRLLPLPMVGAFLLAVVGAMHRITGRFWPGAVAVVLMLIGLSINPFDWSAGPIFDGAIIDNLWVSPTQTFAMMFFAVVIYQLAGMFQADRAELRRPLPWIVLTVLLGAVAGAKATFIPMVLCGLVLAVVLRGVFARRIGPELPALGITGAWFAFAQLVLYGSGSQGAELYPLQTIKFTALGQAVMGPPVREDQWPPMLALTGLAVLAVAFGWAGMIGLLRREWRMQPIVHVMLGFAASGVGGLWLIAHPGLSQTYFARSAVPYLAMASAIGLASLIPAGRPVSRWFAGLGVGGVVLGAAGLIVIRETAGARKSWVELSPGNAALAYGAVALLLAVTGVAIAIVAWRVRLPRRLTVALLALVVLGTTVTSGAVDRGRFIRAELAANRQLHTDDAARSPAGFPRGALKAGRWLRDHSRPLDIVATNSHCRPDLNGCDSRDFWLAAYSERRIVVEGWSYTEKAFEAGTLWTSALGRRTFWDQDLLAANDAMFYTPTAENVASFTKAHRVRWLVAVTKAHDPTLIRETRELTASRRLGHYATERFRTGDITIYEVR
ncbi:hypothetical protein AB0J83_33245 [Actinoplanes sp. NPDC049596]|uniref:hypothetical protein n=1 Tax=unclassified Actinoplanes TaxID=2626549 RepID=UPI0034308C08